MVTRAGSVPQVHLSAGPVQLGREGGEDQGMGEGSVTRGGNDCCSMIWFDRLPAGSQVSWCTPPWLSDQGEEEGIVRLPDQEGRQGIVWLPNKEEEIGAIGLPDR